MIYSKTIIIILGIIFTVFFLAPSCPPTLRCPNPKDPKVHYVSEDPDECAVIRFTCDKDQTMFNDKCGCGCIDQ